MRTRSIATLALSSLVLSTPAPANDYVVAPSGGDFTSVQAALDFVSAGDRILVMEKPGGYIEKVQFVTGGSAAGGWVELLAFPGHAPVLDGTGVPGVRMIQIEDLDYIRVQGITLRNNLNVPNDGSGIRVEGKCDHIELLDNVIHDMRGFGSMGITVYGSSLVGPISNIVIDGNLVYDCEPADSEGITLNGDVEGFEVTNNVVRDVNNIAIDFIGGETSIHPTAVARDGVCRGNVVLRANANYGGGFAGGIYVDGARDILIEGNYVAGSDMGIEIGAENPGILTTGIIVRNNLFVQNEKAGMVFGGFDATVGRVENCEFVNNVCYGNDILDVGLGELWIQFADNNLVANNIFYAGPNNYLLTNSNATTGNYIDYNVWFANGAPEFVWNSVFYGSLAAYSATGNDTSSQYINPQFVDPDGPDNLLGSPDDDFRLLSSSPAIDAGDSEAIGYYVELDFAGEPRHVDRLQTVDTGTGLKPLVDAGAHEFQPPTWATARRCFAAPNSVGDGGFIGFSGTNQVSANNFVLEGAGLPSSPGLYYYGMNAVQIPFGDGQRCVGGTTFRLNPPVVSTPSGTSTRPVNLTAPPASSGAGMIASGSTWQFQLWYRDPSGGMAGFNLTDAIAVSFCP